MIGFTNAGGFDRLKLRVLYGTQTPSNPQENDIYVKTGIAIPSWEFSETENPTWSMSKGFVYFTSTYVSGYDQRQNTGLNFLKKNTIYTNLLGCYQYDGSSWHRMDAYIYHSGWKKFSSTWDGTLYYNGNQYTDHTGGWMVRLKGASGGTLTPSLHGYAEGTVTMTTLGKVDLTSFSKLNFTGYGWEESSGGRDKVHCIVDTAQINPSSNSFPSGAARLDFSGNETSGTYALDISSLSGSYYVGFYAVRNENKIHIEKVWLT